LEKLNAKFSTNFKRDLKHISESIGRGFCNILFFPFCSEISKKYIKYMQNLYSEIIVGSMSAIGYGIIFGFFVGVIVYLISLNK